MQNKMSEMVMVRLNQLGKVNCSRSYRSSIQQQRKICRYKRFVVTAAKAEPAVGNLQQLEQLLNSDKREDEESALKLMEKMVEEKIVRGFGQGRQIPKRTYTLEELKLNSIQPEKLLAPKDDTIIMIRNIARIAFAAGVVGMTELIGGDLFRNCVIAAGGLLTFLWFDQAITGGGLETLMLDSLGRQLLPEYRNRVALHEAGHFLTAYLFGLLPKSYSLSTWEAIRKEGMFNVQAGCRYILDFYLTRYNLISQPQQHTLSAPGAVIFHCQTMQRFGMFCTARPLFAIYGSPESFCDTRFNEEVKSGKLSASSLAQYTCVALAGVATEYERFGHAEGGLSDVQQLDQLLFALKFSQLKADAEIRWAVLNIIFLLRRHKQLHTELAKRMDEGQSVVTLIQLIEDYLFNVKSEDI
eukprot:TRINITY_DN27439_c0_g1_i5.p1 TRINITY_DN27439_c0_g1~~TRINITY_DN27439_c0_g1_i5.p1  ORF type:complete len:412 (-),score=32.95 TRINITY_DN27439_c0_g1_i5:306-1541(-)